MKKNAIKYEVSEEDLLNNQVKNIINFLEQMEKNHQQLHASLVIKFPEVNSVIKASANLSEVRDDFIRKVYNHFIELFYFLSDNAQKISIFHSILRVRLYGEMNSRIDYKIRILKERIRKDTLKYGESIDDLEGAQESIIFLNEIYSDQSQLM